MRILAYFFHNLTDIGVLYMKMMGSNFQSSRSPFWAPMSPDAHSKPSPSGTHVVSFHEF